MIGLHWLSCCFQHGTMYRFVLVFKCFALSSWHFQDNIVKPSQVSVSDTLWGKAVSVANAYERLTFIHHIYMFK